MPSFRTVAVLLLTVTLLFGLVPARRVLPAQVAGQAKCDATLVTLLLVGIRDYGYQAPIRLDYYDFAQYRFLVEAAVGSDLPPDLTGGDATTEQVAGLIEQVTTRQAGDDAIAADQPVNAPDDPGTTGTSPTDGATLDDGSLPGEPEICSLLRADLVNFLYDHLNTGAFRP